MRVYRLLGTERNSRRAAVQHGYSAPPVIANWSTTPGLGRHLLNTNFPLPALHRQVPIDPAKL